MGKLARKWNKWGRRFCKESPAPLQKYDSVKEHICSVAREEIDDIVHDMIEDYYNKTGKMVSVSKLNLTPERKEMIVQAWYNKSSNKLLLE